MSKFIIVEKPEKIQVELDCVEVITPTEYISGTIYQSAKKIKILNLCRSYAYQSLGYYVSLLAEARGHKVLPSIQAIQEIRWTSFIRSESQDFDDLIQQTFKAQDEKAEFNIYFGKTQDESYQKLANQLFSMLQVPFLKVSFTRKVKWMLSNLRPLNITEIPEEDNGLFLKSLDLYFSSQKNFNINSERIKYDLAILVNPEDPNPPSDQKAIQKFVRAAEKLNFNTELIGKADLGKLIQFDALFLRETTYVNHHTFRFAKKAQSEGLIVVDDPNSILKCTNKVYLYELLTANKIPTPKSLVLRKGVKSSTFKKLEYPLILKQPDGAFSRGVKKVEHPDELKKALQEMFQKSELVITQEFLPTPFDWRIGLIDGEVIYVNKYFMARGHWQIVNWDNEGSDKEGGGEAVPVEQAPPKLLSLALKAAGLIGKGLYGVDIKEVNGKYFVIEINDNPSIDFGVEDRILKDKLYLQIMNYFKKRM